MQFPNEKELQLYMASVMAANGTKVELEVTTHNGLRIDIVTSRYAIECKPTLTRDALLQAVGQMGLYARSFPDHEYVLAGMSPRSESGYKAARNIAEVIKEEHGYTVWFIDRMSYFSESEPESASAPVPASETNYRYIPCNPNNLIDDVYGLKRQRTGGSETSTTSQSKGRRVAKTNSYTKAFIQISRYILALWVSYATIEGIYNRVKSGDSALSIALGVTLGVAIVYVIIKYPFRNTEEKGK